MKGLMIFHARMWEQLKDGSWITKAAERHDTVRRAGLAEECNCDYIFSRHFGGGYSSLTSGSTSEKGHEHNETGVSHSEGH